MFPVYQSRGFESNQCVSIAVPPYASIPRLCPDMLAPTIRKCYTLNMTVELVEKCPDTLRRMIEASPHASYDLILRVSEVGEDQQKQIEEAGFAVRRCIRLVPSFVVTGSGDALFDLLGYPWLLAVEPDRPVHLPYN